MLARELNSVLPEQKIAEICSRLTGAPVATAEHDRLRALLALDWLTHCWLGHWYRTLAGDEQFAGALAILPPIRDMRTAEQTGDLLWGLQIMERQADENLAVNYREDDFYDMVTVSAARQASTTSPARTAGSAFADAAAATALDETLAARADGALTGVRSLARSYCLDEVWNRVKVWVGGPGSADAKRISIKNLAPATAQHVLQPVTEHLQNDAARLYLDLHRMG
ncbi:hypothetical protein [Lentzea sp. NPDC059081]|uniref:hypothetical protein n=1 Tax=Lentzea sp. NPDC059081 TaxID=3346719 RepID=UPI0036AD289C